MYNCASYLRAIQCHTISKESFYRTHPNYVGQHTSLIWAKPKHETDRASEIQNNKEKPFAYIRPLQTK